METAAGSRERKARGGFYTPPHVVDFVLDATLGRLLDETTSLTARPLRVLDPSCGDGAFLLPAFRRILARHAGTGPQLPPAERLRILLDHVHGVDLDPAAVEACRRRLLDAAFEGSDDGDDARADAARALARNVRCGDALLAPEPLLGGDGSVEFAWADAERGFGAVLADGGFDAVVGNPPYLNLKRGFLGLERKRRLEEAYRTAAGQYDAFALFGELALRLLRTGGRHGFVLPRPVLASESYRTLRELYWAAGLTDVAECGQPFAGAGVESVVLVVCKDRPPPAVRIVDLGRDGAVRVVAETPTAAFGRLPNRNFSTRLDEGTLRVLRRLEHAPRRLGDVAAVLTRGLECGKRDRAVRRFRPGPGLRPLVRGQDVHRYRLDDPALGFDPAAASPRVLKDPAVYDALPKLLLRRVAPAVMAALDVERRWALNAVYCLVPRPGISPRALLGVLNSSVPSFWLRAVFLSDDRLFPYLRLSQLVLLPLPDLAGTAAPVLAELEELVERRMAAHGEEAGTLDERIDAVAAELYGLGEDDRAAVATCGPRSRR